MESGYIQTMLILVGNECIVSIKKLDKKIKFKKLKKGSYTYQIIAKDSVQELMLVNKQFIVR